MNLKEFRERTKNLPDTTEIVVSDGIDTFELYKEAQEYPAFEKYNPIILFRMGQKVDADFELDFRDAWRVD